MTRNIFRLCLTLALSCCLLAPAANADGGNAPGLDHMAAALTGLAEEGHAGAQYQLGILYLKSGEPENLKKALSWLRKAADQGLDKACHTLGAMYAEGHGTPKNGKEAAKWFRKAAETGAAESQFSLGVLYAQGDGVPQNDGEAAKWFRKAADQGHARAQYRLADLYDTGRGVKQSDVEAVAWYRKAAEQGMAHAQYRLGWRHFTGEGAPRDGNEARKWWGMAAEDEGFMDSHAAQCHVFESLVMGVGVPAGQRETVAKQNQQILEFSCPPELRFALRGALEQTGGR